MNSCNEKVQKLFKNRLGQEGWFPTSALGVGSHSMVWTLRVEDGQRVMLGAFKTNAERNEKGRWYFDDDSKAELRVFVDKDGNSTRAGVRVPGASALAWHCNVLVKFMRYFTNSANGRGWFSMMRTKLPPRVVASERMSEYAKAYKHMWVLGMFAMPVARAIDYPELCTIERTGWRAQWMRNNKMCDMVEVVHFGEWHDYDIGSDEFRLPNTVVARVAPIDLRKSRTHLNAIRGAEKHLLTTAAVVGVSGKDLTEQMRVSGAGGKVLDAMHEVEHGADPTVLIEKCGKRVGARLANEKDRERYGASVIDAAKHGTGRTAIPTFDRPSPYSAEGLTDVRSWADIVAVAHLIEEKAAEKRQAKEARKHAAV